MRRTREPEGGMFTVRLSYTIWEQLWRLYTERNLRGDKITWDEHFTQVVSVAVALAGQGPRRRA